MHSLARSLRFAVRLSVLCAIFSSLAAAQAAPTSYVDDFSGPMHGWAKNRSYHMSQKDGTLVMDVSKQTKWTGEWLDLGGVHDFSAHPYVNVRAKTDTPCILYVYLNDGKNNDLLPRKLRAVDGYVTLSYDFSGTKKLNLKTIKGMIFTVNGAANSWSGKITINDLKVGDAARKLASIEGVHDQIDYHDTGRHSVLLTGIEGAASFKVSGAENLIRNTSVGPVKDGLATLTYECIPGATGKGTVTVTAVGAPGYADNTVSFPLTIEPNLPPTIDQPADMTVQIGVPQTVRLTGISDGNIAAEQPLTITAGNMQAAHASGSPYATLSFTPKTAGTRTVTVTLDDHSGGNAVTKKSFQVHTVPQWNHPPTIDQLQDMTLFLDNPEQRVGLSGITDGDGGGQPLKLSVTSSDPSVIAASVEYNRGTTGRLRLVPNAQKTGKTTITVTVADGGGAPDNNGDQSTQMSFSVTTRHRPVAGWSDSFADWGREGKRWAPESSMDVSQTTMDGQSVVKVVCKDKITFGGLWLHVPDLDLSAAPYLTVDVKPQDNMQFNVYFYDGKGKRNGGANQVKRIQGGRWQTVTFDFSGGGQMSTNKGRPIAANWVTGVLFNFHPKLAWPFTRYSGTILFRNLRIGTDANVPKRQPQATVAEVPDQVYLAGVGRRQVMLSGIGSGSAEAASVKAGVTGAPVIKGLTVGSVGQDGTTPLSYEVGPQTGEATVTVDVSAPGSLDKKVSFDVEVLDAGRAVPVKIDCADRHQLIRGFGTYMNDLPADLYAKQLGASAMRIGLIANQIEPVNDNSDPNVLYEGALNRKVFDFAHFRALHKAGVESFILTSWSPPAWMKTNLSMNYQQGNAEGNSDTATNRLDYYQYQEFAESMVAAAKVFKEETGFNLTGIGLQNEPAFDEPYPSAILDPRHFVELIKIVGPRLKAAGIPVKLYMPEQVFSQTRSMNNYIAALDADPVAEKYCDVIATHGYDRVGRRGMAPDFPHWKDMWKRSQQGGVAKELWMTETGFGYHGWDSALGTAVTIYGGLEFGNIGLSTTWAIEGQLVNRSQPNPTFYVCSQFFRAIRPGAHRVTSSTAAAGVLATSYVNDAAHGGTLACVLINTADSARAVRLDVVGRPALKGVSLSRTDRVNHHAEVGAPAAGGVILLPPKSVTTVVGK